MKRLLFFWVIGLSMSMAASVPVTKAELISVLGGTSAPESFLGPYEMMPFAEDLRPVLKKYSFVTSPLGGNVTFDMLLEHRTVPDQWALWSHDYLGDVYWTGEDEKNVNMTMPAGTNAFYFYVEPDYKGLQTITAVAFDGYNDIETIIQEVDGNSGASYFGFYCTGGSFITDITVLGNNADLAVGEFGISTIPVPEAFLLGNIGLGMIMGLTRYRLL